MRLIRLAAAVAAVVGLPVVARAQAPEYRSLAGVTFTADADTGGVLRAEIALAADPRNVDRLLALGLAQSAIRRYREAIETFTRGLEIDPDNAVLLRWRGHRYISTGDFDRALADLTRGNALDPKLYGIWYHLGIARFAQGDFAGAADAFAHGQPLAPDDNEYAGSTDWRWMALSRAGRAEDAAQVLASMRGGLKITTATAYAQRLRLYAGQATPEQVVTPADTAAIQVATLSFGVGNWYLVRGDTAHARAWFGKAVASGGWPGFGFLLAERELAKLR